MKVAIDKDCVEYIEDFREFDYIYVYEDELLEDLLKLKLHCIYKDYVEFVDINLTKYDIECLKKTTIEDKHWKDKPEKPDYTGHIHNPFPGAYSGTHRQVFRR